MIEGHKDIIERHLRNLIGLRLALTRNIVAAKNFQFGSIRAVKNGTVGEYALHIACSWRFVNAAGEIVTGAGDRYRPPSSCDEVEEENWRTGDLQAERLLNLLGGADEATRAHVNVTQEFVVQDVSADALGGFEIKFSGGLTLQVFPDSSGDESWRFFQPGSKKEHLVVGAAALLETP